jgi:endonuclease-3 related protein
MGKGRRKKHKKIPAEETKELLNGFYAALFNHFGKQKWWPARTRFEVIVGAFLTQNTNWGNVERAIKNLKKASLLTPGAMYGISKDTLAQAIVPAGYFNVKAGRLKNFLEVLYGSYSGSLTKLFKIEHPELRERLLSINGIGPETADSILLYAAKKPAFVVDAYTKRIMERHGVVDKDVGYHDLQKLFTDNLESSATLFNEYHALIVMTGKEFCRTKEPLCETCPLGGFL